MPSRLAAIARTSAANPLGKNRFCFGHVVGSRYDRAAVGEYRDLVRVDVKSQQEFVAFYRTRATQSRLQLRQVDGLITARANLDGTATAQDGGGARSLAAQPFELKLPARRTIYFLAQTVQTHLAHTIAPQIDNRQLKADLVDVPGEDFDRLVSLN